MRETIQKFGRSLSAMVMPNIGAFIAWGLITAIFIDGGWWPDENVAKMVSPMLKYLLPTLIAFTAGKNVGGYRGGVAGAVAAMGVIIGTDTPMFLGAMIMGPLAGWCVRRFDRLIEGKVGAGFEMLVDNFSLGIIAMILSIIGYLLIGHAVASLTDIFGRGVNWMLAHSLNPLLAILVDPAKVLFLNNAVNHGIMTPLGIQQAAEMGQSMLFLVDPNPGPGLGILLACWLFGRGTTRQSAPGAVIIQLFGGIHEIYFPYVLARPLLLLPVIIGNICALTFFTVTDFGLVAPASPGSLISIILMSPRGKTILGILGVFIGAAVSCLLAWPIVRSRPDFQGDAEEGDSCALAGADPEPCTVSSGSGNFTASGSAVSAVNLSRFPPVISKIYFCCDAGMGSSALGATRFKARLMKAGLQDIRCTNCAVGEIPGDASIVVCQKELAGRARLSGKEVVVISNFLKDSALDALLSRLQSQESAGDVAATGSSGSGKPACNGSAATGSSGAGEPAILLLENVLTGLPSEPKEDAIRRAGQMLFSSGYVNEAYVDSMLEREKITTTYMGSGLAVPHGTGAAKSTVKHSGLVVLQYPDGVSFVDGEDPARLVIGIAGAGAGHLEILSAIAGTLEDQDILDRLCTTADAMDIFETLNNTKHL